MYFKTQVKFLRQERTVQFLALQLHLFNIHRCIHTLFQRRSIESKRGTLNCTCTPPEAHYNTAWLSVSHTELPPRDFRPLPVLDNKSEAHKTVSLFLWLNLCLSVSVANVSSLVVVPVFTKPDGEHASSFCHEQLCACVCVTERELDSMCSYVSQ